MVTNHRPTVERTEIDLEFFTTSVIPERTTGPVSVNVKGTSKPDRQFRDSFIKHAKTNLNCVDKIKVKNTRQ